MKVLIFLILIFSPTLLSAQTDSTQTYRVYSTENIHNYLLLNNKTGSVQQIQNDGSSWSVNSSIDFLNAKEGRYRLYKTQNTWNFILLDTYTGQCWQTQFSIKENNRGKLSINSFPLAYPSDDSDWTDRFQLFETKNIWIFILLDTYTGKTWQVQFSVDSADELHCTPLNTVSLSEESNSRRYSLHQTNNIWNFILVDSFTGKLWQVQFSLESSSERQCIPINEIELASGREKSCFSIVPMSSMYQFYLVDNDTGEMWKFQWSTKGNSYRWIEKFEY